MNRRRFLGATATAAAIEYGGRNSVDALKRNSNIIAFTLKNPRVSAMPDTMKWVSPLK
jgi:hypothetical protein